MATHFPQSHVVARRVNESVGQLRDRGHGLTSQRYAVVRALVKGGEHPSAEQLFHRVSDAYPLIKSSNKRTRRPSTR
jgi:Fe2+ or Zn2+ uptake regulation protein